jgi:hypothetical protein
VGHQAALRRLRVNAARGIYSCWPWISAAPSPRSWQRTLPPDGSCSRRRIRPLGGVDHGILAALRQSEVRPANLSASGYGTTVVINAVTERTARRPPGFPRGDFDVLEMVHLNWPDRCRSSPQIVAVPKSTAVKLSSMPSSNALPNG